MQQRKDEIAAKRARLAELKRQRELRQQDFGASRQSVTTQDEVVTRSATPRPEQRDDLDNLIASLVGKTSLHSGVAHSQSPTTATTVTTPRTLNKALPPDHTVNAGELLHRPLAWSLAPLAIVQTEARPPHREAETYSKGVQTTPNDAQTTSDSSDSDKFRTKERPPRRRLSLREPHVVSDRNKSDNVDKAHTYSPKPYQEQEIGLQRQDGSHASVPRLVPNHELEALALSNDFQNFLELSSKVAERAIEEQYDVLKDYRLGEFNDSDENEDAANSRQRRGIRVKEIAQLYDGVWSKQRMISDIAWSPKFSELLLASYTKNTSAPHDPDGIIQVWNMNMHTRPEYIFHATTEIMTAKFSPFHPNLIVGGSYAGQVLLWDTRSRSPWAVQKSAITDKGHTHPIYSMNVVGTQNAHNIVSTSTDGTVCTWSFDMLSEPQQQMQLTAPSPDRTTTSLFARLEEVAPTCTAFPALNPSYFLAGTEQGTIYLCHAQSRAGMKAGIDAYVEYRSHLAPVMSVDFHRSNGPVDCGDLLISCGLDWSIKLWQVKPPAPGIAANPNSKATLEPLLDLARDEAVYDVKWSPVRPAVFAAVNGAGSLEIWNLNANTESPAAVVSPSSSRDDMSTRGLAPSLNKCAWEMHDGKRVAVGGLDGRLTIFEVGSELGGAQNARADEWTMLKRVARS